MKIARIEDLHCDAGWRVFSFLKITTDDGLVGWSEYNESYGSYGLTTIIRKLGERQHLKEWIVQPKRGALLDRGNVASGRYAIEFAGGKSVSLRNLTLTGAEWGLLANDADNLLLANSRAINNALGGFYVNTDVTDAPISGNEAFGTAGNASTDQDQGEGTNGALQLGPPGGNGSLRFGRPMLRMVERLVKPP